jgi:hypothetical protein
VDGEPKKRPPGRPVGWRKSDKFEAHLPSMRVSEDLMVWLESEKKLLGLASITDVVRLKLHALKRQSEKV